MHYLPSSYRFHKRSAYSLWTSSHRRSIINITIPAHVLTIHIIRPMLGKNVIQILSLFTIFCIIICWTAAAWGSQDSKSTPFGASLTSSAYIAGKWYAYVVKTDIIGKKFRNFKWPVKEPRRICRNNNVHMRVRVWCVLWILLLLL